MTVGSGRVTLNQPAEPYLGKVVPAANAHLTGMYSALTAWPLVGIHMALLPNGHVVSYGTPPGAAQQGGFSYDDWDPAAGRWRDAAKAQRIRTYHSTAVLLPGGSVLTAAGWRRCR